jgi:phosphatidyl-myo-inositol alpha-mannosyltransferase
MNIALLVDDQIDKEDGVQAYMKTIADYYAGLGHRVAFVAPNSPGYKGSIRLYGLAKSITVKFNHNKLKVPRPANNQAITEFFTDFSPDIIHVQMPYSPMLSGKVIKKAHELSVPIVATFHILPFGQKEIMATRLLASLTTKTTAMLAQVFAVSEPARAFCDQYFATKSIVIPNCVKIPVIKKSSMGATRKRIVFVGRLVSRKGVQHLLAAIQLAKTKDIEVIIAGDGALRQKLETKYKPIAEFLGFVSNDQKYQLLASADLAIYPATGGESFGIVLIEALAARTPIVLGGNNLGYSSVLPSDHLFDPQNHMEFAKVIDKYLNITDEQRQSTVNNQQRILHDFDVQVVGQKLIDQYQKAIKLANSPTQALS